MRCPLLFLLVEGRDFKSNMYVYNIFKNKINSVYRDTMNFDCAVVSRTAFAYLLNDDFFFHLSSLRLSIENSRLCMLLNLWRQIHDNVECYLQFNVLQETAPE